MLDRIEILKGALTQRIDEVLSYQINIDNYTLAIVELEARGDPDLDDFLVQLQNLLETERVEQKKAIIMRDVIAKQVEGV